MAGIFDIADIPAWMSPTRNVLETGRQATPIIAENFSSAFRQSQQQKFEQDKIKTQQQQIVTKFAPIAEKLKGADTPEAAWDVVSKNPQWLADPQTAPGVGNYLKMQAGVAAAEAGSIMGKTKIADVTDFTKRLSTIPAGDRAAISGMSTNKDGTPSATQWQALGLAEETTAQHQQNIATQAEIDAAQRGDTVTTTVTPKGVTQKYAPPSAKDKAFVPESPVEYKNGSKLIHVSPNRWQYIGPDKKATDISTGQLRAIAQDTLKRSPKDPAALEIMDKLSAEALKQLNRNNTTNSTSGEVLPIDASRTQIKNSDGSVSTERTITIEADGKYHLIRTIINGKQISKEEAKSLWKSGKNPEVAVFDNAKDAEDYAVQRSNRIGDALKTSSGLNYKIVPLP